LVIVIASQGVSSRQAILQSSTEPVSSRPPTADAPKPAQQTMPGNTAHAAGGGGGGGGGGGVTGGNDGGEGGGGEGSGGGGEGSGGGGDGGGGG